MVVRRICVVTSSRADYGLLRPLLVSLAQADDIELVLAVTGAHLSAAHGSTVSEILGDQLRIGLEVPIDLAADDRNGMAKAMGQTILGFAQAFSANRPDLVLVLGDRYEIFAVAACAFTLGIPVGHIHGGEVTVGALDDSYRHAITKLSWLHFTSTESHRKRVLQLGEDPDLVFVVGALGIDSMRELPLASRDDTVSDLGLPHQAEYVLVTVHPETAGQNDGRLIVDGIMQSLLDQTDLYVVATNANADAGGRAINDALERWKSRHPDRIRVFVSLGQRRYLSAMRYARAVVGNSSSGIIEAPSMRVPSLDVGDRQRGRVRAQCVDHCGAAQADIGAGLRRVLSAEAAEVAAACSNPYDLGGAACRILAVLRSEVMALPVSKHFHDIAFGD